MRLTIQQTHQNLHIPLLKTAKKVLKAHYFLLEIILSIISHMYDLEKSLTNASIRSSSLHNSSISKHNSITIKIKLHISGIPLAPNIGFKYISMTTMPKRYSIYPTFRTLGCRLNIFAAIDFLSSMNII